MADKTINELTAATTMGNDDLLVLQQGGTAKKLSGKQLGDYVYNAAAEKVAEVNQAVDDARSSINDIVESVQSMTELGTDTTLTTTGMAADAKAAGDKIKEVETAALADLSKGAAIESMIAGRETAMEATKNYTSGSLVIVNDALYKLDANVASGESLIPEINCHITTVEAVITSRVPSSRTVNGKTLSSDITLTAEDIAYDDSLSTHTSGSVGEVVSDLKESLSDSSDGFMPITEYVEGQYISSATGRFSNSNGDGRTGFLKIPDGMKTLTVISPEASIYNAFYSSADDTTKVGDLKYSVGTTNILIPSGANYFALSCSKANIKKIKVVNFIQTQMTECKNTIDTNIDNAFSVASANEIINNQIATRWSLGYIAADGTESVNNTFIHSDYISVPYGYQLTYSVDSIGTSDYLFEYDANKTFIRRLNKNDGILNWFESSADARFVRVGLWQNEYTGDMYDIPDHVHIRLNPFKQRERRYITAKGNLSPNDIITATNQYTQTEYNHIMTNKHLSFFANISTMGEFEIHHGNTEYGSSWVVIDSTTAKVYIKESGDAQLVKTETHGLTIANTIGVIIDADDNYTATIRVYSDGAWYQFTSAWDGINGSLFVKSTSATFTDCVLTFTCDGYWKDIQLYGDSYFGLTSDVRWTYYAKQSGYLDNCLVDGFPGNWASSGLATFKENIQHKIPKYAVFCLGMNDPDTASAINAEWKTSVDTFLSICDRCGIEPILATIPTANGADPENFHNNAFKNTYVRNSGRRYIDFANAVGANDTTGDWYAGMLLPDGIHPTSLGAKALYMAVLTEFPEIQH